MQEAVIHVHPKGALLAQMCIRDSFKAESRRGVLEFATPGPR